MNLLISFLSGFVCAFVGITPPGLLNMTAAKVSMKEGKRSAFWFIFGAGIIIFIQVYLAVFFARIINNNTDILLLFREVGFAVFGLLSLYFLWFAKKAKINKPKMNKQNRKNRFFMGMLLSSVNLMPIPYYAFITITLSSYSYFWFDNSSVFAFVSGAVLGTLLVFYGYVTFFQKIESKTDYFTKNMNTILGIISGLVSLISLINIVKYYLI